MAKQKRLAAVLLVVLVLVAMATSLFVLAHEADHDCVGEGCSVCAVISLCRNTLKALCGTLIAAATVFECLRFGSEATAAFRAFSSGETPITLKVKLLN